MIFTSKSLVEQKLIWSYNEKNKQDIECICLIKFAIAFLIIGRYIQISFYSIQLE